MNSKALAKATAILALVLLVSPVSGAEPLPELDCLVEPNVVVDVGSPEHGVVETISVDRSDTVAADEVLATLESSEQAANVRKARARSKMAAEINARKATLEFAQRKQERMRDLFASDAISTQQQDEVETELKMAQMQLQQARDAGALARIELDRAVGDLDRRTIRSPISGIVVERFVSPGEYVNEKPLLRVAQMHPLRVETVAPAKLFGQIKTGMRARVVSDTLGGQVFDAEVTIVDRMIDAASGTFGVRLELPNPDYAIPSGLNCRLRILPQQRTVSEPETVVEPTVTPAAVAAKSETSSTRAAELETADTKAKSEPVAATAKLKTAAPAAQIESPATTVDPEPAESLAKSKAAGANRESEPVASTTPEPAAQAETLPLAKSKAAGANRESEPVASTTPEPAAQAETLKPAAPTAESEPAVTASKVKPAAPTAAVAVPVQPLVLACTTFGPFDSDDQLAALLATLGAGAREVGRRAEDDEKTDGFFVATRPLGTMAAAQRLSESLEKFGISDLTVLPEGPTGGRVSLGMFADQNHAKTLQQKLAGLGIETEVLPHRLKTRQVWLDVEMSAKALEQAPWNTLTAKVRTAGCPPSVRDAAVTSRDKAIEINECRSIGPFAKEQQIDALVAALGSDSREIDRRRQRDEIETGYVIVTKPQVSVDEARALAASIRDRGVKDLAVMKTGAYKGRVSLGLYTQKTTARIRLQEMRNLDIDVEIVPRRNVAVQFWSDVELSANTIKQAPWKKIAPNVTTTDCPPSSYVMADAAPSP